MPLNDHNVSIKVRSFSPSIQMGKNEILLTGETEEIIDFLEINSIRKQIVGSLPYGLRKRIELGRALALEPELLLLDEPFEGLAPVIVQEIEKTLQVIREQGMTTIIVEQNAVAALKLSDRAVILDTGQLVYQGAAQEVLDDESLRHEYLAI